MGSSISDLWETNGVKVNHPRSRLGFDAFESRSTLADPRPSTIYDTRAHAYMLAVYPPNRSEINGSPTDVKQELI